MIKATRTFIVLGILLSMTASVIAQQSAYTAEIDQWHASRMASLKAENGWLNLAGLYWLDEGKNSFGSGTQNKLIFPAGTIAENAGYFERSGNTVKLVSNGQADFLVNGVTTKLATIYAGDSTSVVRHGQLKWTIIKRGEKLGVRLRNLGDPAIENFKAVDRYPVDEQWKVEAKLMPRSNSGDISITNMIGQTNNQKSPGTLVFKLQGKEYSLDALEEEGELFIVFADVTTGVETYPSGRFLKARFPGKDGIVIVDFNKAYNPPCAFTPYATCPLPPKQNELPIAIHAGEKKYEYHAL